ncbi:hypothetical protein CSAL01_01496 [Colletotrichum salicis]|uniref:Nephrocystin 3-like N-terminal domain-containing protein n=1 Tax=Colletotrichum salicis TaxID=1209931 RepID=A0A135V5B7_9PEZI|nr:hypothetical protein CSAL01_01496 [Colletotrichum salicis]
MELQSWDAFQETLPPAEYMKDIHRKNLALRQPGTCSWIFDSEVYRRWENEKNKTLFCIGPPGVGKSVLAAVVLDRLRKSDSIVLFLSCENDSQQMDYLTGCLIQQLLAEVYYGTDMELLAKLSSPRKGDTIGNTNADLKEYIASRVKPPASYATPEHVEFYDVIFKAIEGIFHVSSRIVDELSPMHTKFEFQQFLRHWAQERRHLNHVFGGLIEARSDHTQSGLASHVINWLTFSDRELTLLELQHALVADVSEYLRVPPTTEKIMSALHGIVTIKTKQGCQSIEFFHSAVKDYFWHERSDRAPKIHDNIVSYCLRQLSRVASGDGFCKSDEDFEERISHNPFFLYAACH